VLLASARLPRGGVHLRRRNGHPTGGSTRWLIGEMANADPRPTTFSASYLRGREATVIPHESDDDRYAPACGPAQPGRVSRKAGLPGRYCDPVLRPGLRAQKGSDVFVEGNCRLAGRAIRLDRVMVGAITPPSNPASRNDAEKTDRQPRNLGSPHSSSPGELENRQVQHCVTG